MSVARQARRRRYAGLPSRRAALAAAAWVYRCSHCGQAAPLRELVLDEHGAHHRDRCPEPER